jgi:superfamily II DNA/RNA helicase
MVPRLRHGSLTIMARHEPRKEEPEHPAPKLAAKKKSSLLGRLKDGIKKLIGGKKKPEPKVKPEPRAPLEKPARPAREHGPKASHEPRSRDKERAPRGDRPERREGGRPERGGRGLRGKDRAPREEREPKPTTRFAPEPPPPAPPVPEGPFPEAFEALGFSPAVLAGIRDLGYATPTEIQSRAAPVVLAGRDVIGASQTGTGKTAAFGLPTMSKLGAPGKLRCLILEPTRELAAQVVEAFEKLSAHTGLRTLLVHGGVGYGKQREGLEKGVDIVVATPGRLLDFLGDGTVSLDTIEVLILDEVDRMLDMGFLPDVRRIVERTPSSRQTLFFSATMPPQIKSLADWALKEPEAIEVGIRFSPAETVSHYLYPVAGEQREELLLAILKQTHFNSAMIFTRMKVQADKLFANLKAMGDYKCAVMHGDIAQKDREKALKDFRDGTCEIIVATDLAARGLDISGVTHVINFNVPDNPEDYVHRIGRTGRAQKEGDAFTLFAADEMKQVEAIENLIKRKIERRKLDGFSYKYTSILDDESHARSVMRTGRGTVRKRR